MDSRPPALLIRVGESDAVSPATVVLGLPILRRTVLTARRAGFDRIVVAVPKSFGAASLIHGTGAELVDAGATHPAGDVVELPARLVPRLDYMRALRHGATLKRELVFEVASPADLPALERWLLRGLIKESEGFMSRHVERRISLAVTRRLAPTRITPNQMTIVSVLVGLVGASFFLSTRPAMETAGALLFLLHSILDGCDGELARLKLLESRWGGVLDFWGDNVVHVAVFLAIAIGWSRDAGAAWPLLLGASAALGTLLSAGFVYVETMRESSEGPLFKSVSKATETRLSRVADALARRDFIYLVVILSAFGKANVFLALAAVGAPLFFLVLAGIAVTGRGRRLERKPV